MPIANDAASPTGNRSRCIVPCTGPSIGTFAFNATTPFADDRTSSESMRSPFASLTTLNGRGASPRDTVVAKEEAVGDYHSGAVTALISAPHDEVRFAD